MGVDGEESAAGDCGRIYATGNLVVADTVGLWRIVLLPVASPVTVLDARFAADAVGGIAFKTAKRLVHSAEAWLVRRRRARAERRSDQRSNMRERSSGSLATMRSRAILASARHEFDIYKRDRALVPAVFKDRGNRAFRERNVGLGSFEDRNIGTEDRQVYVAHIF